MNRTLLTLLLLFFSLAWFHAIADELSSSLLFTAKMDGPTEVPSVTTSGQGLAVFTFDEKKSTLYVLATLSNLSGPITGVHIHEGAPGENGGVIFNLTPFLNGNRVKGAIYNVSKAMVATFIRGGYYINAHTEMNPDGEIRGQIGLETDLRYAALLKGANEVPEVTTNGTGLFVANFSGNRNEVKFKMIFEGLSSPVIGAHIHQGAAGVNGGVIFDLTSFIAGNVLNGVWDATGFLDALSSGELYVNVHTVDHPDGEMRGQLLLQEGLTFDAVMNGGQEVPAVDTKGKALAIVTVRPELNEVGYYILFDSLSGPAVASHFHEAPAGVSGGVVINISSGINGNVISGTSTLSTEQLNQLLKGGLYLNIHTPDHPSGEIRGQVYKLAREPYVFEINGGQETPPNNVPGTGTGMATIDRDQTNLHYKILYTGLQGTFSASHFHYAEPGVAGPVIFALTNSFDSLGYAEGYWDEHSTVAFDDSIAEFFEENEVYANIHSNMFPGGEIRGNLIHVDNLFTDQPFDPHFGKDLSFFAEMTGDDENPAVTTDGHGLATIYFSEDRTTAKVNVTVTGLSGPLTGAHIHDGVTGVNGPVIFPLTFVGNRIQTEITGITAEQFAKFIDGSYYINVHTAQHPGGEIRGQILVDQDVTLLANLTGDQQNPAVTTDGKGLGAFHYTIGQLTLDVNVQLTELSSDIVGAHLHTGFPGENGPVIIDLGSLLDGNRIRGTVDLTIQDIISIALGDVYINVHTVNHPDGEIRGQLNLQTGLTFDGWMSGLQEVPFVTTTASGLAVATVASDLSTVNVAMVTDGASGTIGAAHFHEAKVGTSGGVVLDLTSGLNDNAIQFSGPLPNGLIGSLLTGDIYINGHTPAFPGGELRGQLFRLARDGYGYDMCPEQEVGVVNAPGATGSGYVSIDRLHTNANIAIVTDHLTGPINAAHFHQAAIGVNGGVIFPLTPFFDNGSVFGYGIPLDTSIINPLRAGNVYSNVHTTLHPGGEMRGQIVKEFLCSIETGVEPIEEIVGDVKLSPVPVGDFLNVELETNQHTTLSMDIVDISGKKISTERFSLTDGKNEVVVNTESLLPGILSADEH